MKRLNLQALGLSVNDLLSKEQMKNVIGGVRDTCNGGYYCESTCPNGTKVICSGFDSYPCQGGYIGYCTGYNCNSGNPTSYTNRCN